jgi:hypothetical protein
MIINTGPDTLQDDTTSVCGRNSITDISFYDSNNIITKGIPDPCNKFPFLFTEKNREIQAREKISLIKHLRPGNDFPSQSLHNDWMIGIIIIIVFLYSLIRATSKSIIPDFSWFFMFRRSNDPVTRNSSGLFNWESTILNLISFLIFGLFAFCAASYYNFVPVGISGILFWLISLCIIILTATFRHLAGVITGNMSGEKEVFREYLLVVYQSYRLTALILFVLILLMSYTVFIPVSGSFISGFVVLGVMYLISVIRLTIIFLNRNISIFYLILYLCALEILPVVISVKYFAGLV